VSDRAIFPVPGIPSTADVANLLATCAALEALEPLETSVQKEPRRRRSGFLAIWLFGGILGATAQQPIYDDMVLCIGHVDSAIYN
jgi:hypothetical protein